MLLIAFQGGAFLFRKPLIHRAVLEEFEGRYLPVDVICHNLQTAEKQRLAHYVEVLGERVHNVDTPLCREGFEPGIIVLLCEGIIHGFHETVGGKPVGNGVADGLRLRLAAGLDAHAERLRQLYVVVPVDAENLLNHIALARDIYHIGRGLHKSTSRPLLKEVVVQGFKDLLNGFVAYLLADESFYPVVVQVYLCAADGLGIHLDLLADDLSSGQLLNEECGPQGTVLCGLRVCSPLVAEAGVCGKLLALCSAADTHGVEVRAFDEHVHRAVADAGILASEHARKAHGADGIGNNHVLCGELALHAVQGLQDLSLPCPADNDLAAADFIGIKGMEGLAVLEQDEVGDVHHVIDGLEADGHELVLQPLGGRRNLYALHGDAYVAGGAVRVQDLHRDFLAFALAESVH